jgi:hypothetical protein
MRARARIHSGFLRYREGSAQVHGGAFNGGVDFSRAFWLAEKVVHTR